MKHLLCLLYRLKHFFCKCDVDEHEITSDCGMVTIDRGDEE
jgi:hypothetical protein